MLVKLGDRVADTATNLAVAGLGTAFMAETASRTAPAYVGGGIFGDEIVGPTAGIVGGVLVGTVSSAAYNSMPNMDSINALRNELCPPRANRGEPHGGPMMRSLDGYGGDQMVFELRNQTALLQQESHARKTAEVKGAHAEEVAKDLSRQLQLQEQVAATAAAAKEADDTEQHVSEQLTAALTAIIKLQLGAGASEEIMQNMQTLHAMSEAVIQ